METSAATFAERRRVVSTVGGGKAMVDVDSGEVSGEVVCDNFRGKRVVVAEENVSRSRPQPRPRHPPSRQRSFRQDFGHIAAETYLITRLAFTLLQYLGYMIRDPRDLFISTIVFLSWNKVLQENCKSKKSNWSMVDEKIKLAMLFCVSECILQLSGVEIYFDLLINDRLSLDYSITCPWLLCHATDAWFSTSSSIVCAVISPSIKEVMELDFHFAYYYFFSKRVRRSVIYGNMPRNRMDLYLPADIREPKPVLIFVTGGAWIIGYKAWGSFLGMQLAERDIIVASIDYRNFPQGTISDMVQDVSQGISCIVNKIAEYGGDPNRIYLMGQSAGAHISACALLDQAIRESGKEDVSWSVSKIKAYFGLSGGYNLLDLVDHFHGRGLYRSIFLSIMEGEKSLRKFSPAVKVLDPSIKDAIPLLPPIILFHGTNDYSIPSDSSKRFADALKKEGAKSELILYEGKTHTDLFLQDPFRGGKDDLFEHVVSIIHSGDDEALAKDATAPPRKRLVPELLLKLASRISPF
ncbi:isoprenylcysteine alpha-carbonyl methylesterase ICME [Senna tora]|uniref:protein-S-isoprenylcysteine alpha-carbonyl methylesterase n=1 Tax=Senna tora TaxID=362788 RepID=A0A834SYG2_9FABA|nr:isoprenylcysteine alpha-carbonyl methylesterase ICME [Senna tora]